MGRPVPDCGNLVHEVNMFLIIRLAAVVVFYARIFSLATLKNVPELEFLTIARLTEGKSRRAKLINHAPTTIRLLRRAYTSSMSN
jgi:hypothetical protein